ncbi:GDNF family receptor alpha-4 isoform X7 [Peromyscus californicus insignis]|uniref:GDNF family receptor alpha-4 isoform X7 n=1 Tax=Peromyscus californicus insignis TaxID=564181 RepID=UPI0022A7126E|nr:GDNF family receptor alpha-4 isoform X7 [Peromyscus californicus insignis]
MGRTKHGGLQPARPSPGSAGSTGGNRCVDAAEACTADAQCQQLRSEYVARCLGRPAPGDRSGPGGCVRSRCRRALRRFFARGPPALTHALLFCRCESPACAERRRQTFAPACAFAGPGPAPPSCLKALDRCERGRLCSRSQKHVLCLRVKAVDECSHTRNVHLSCLLPHGGKENSTTPQVSLCSFAPFLELALETRLASNSQRSACLCLPSAGIKGVRHHRPASNKNF